MPAKFLAKLQAAVEILNMHGRHSETPTEPSSGATLFDGAEGSFPFSSPNPRRRIIERMQFRVPRDEAGHSWLFCNWIDLGDRKTSLQDD